MNVITGIDLPWGSPGGSVELLRDLYLTPNPPVAADVFMLAGGADPPEHAALGLLSVPGKALDAPGFWSYVDRLAAAIRQRYVPGDYGVTHLQHLAFGATPALLRAFPDLPSVALVHGTDLLFAADNPTQGEVLRETVAAAHRIVAPTSAMAALLTSVSDVDTRRIRHIPWGIPDRLLAAPPARYPRPGDDLRVLYAGRLTDEKGVPGLLSAAAALTGVRLAVAAPVAEFQVLAREHDLTGVRYLGWFTRPHLWRTFGEYDLLIVPSTRLEAFGLVAVEAQACGLPVLYQPVPGLQEVLGDSALPIELGSGRAADVISWLRKDPGALDELRAAGYRNAARFPLSRTGRELRALSAELQG